jgi:putative membrane protein
MPATITPMPISPQQDPRVYFAAERTFLAWIRTGLGLMGVGFAVSRFGLFLREFSATQHTPTQTSTTHSVITGVALVALGVLINITAVVNHLTIIKKLSTGTWQPGQPSRTAVALAMILALLGTGMAIYLIRFR